MSKHKYIKDRPSKEEKKIIKKEKEWEKNRTIEVNLVLDHRFMKLVRWCAEQQGYQKEDIYPKDPKRFSMFCQRVLIDYSKSQYIQYKKEIEEKEKMQQQGNTEGTSTTEKTDVTKE
ncbi:hypothetical protein M0R04_08860 [Candidatus Dojkabacteria bacterium]|jgi:hypothetical protein|nr:hypothetical protein [Candidatus Dojkabacteria bacterium]